jgi:hypothetical protein
VDVAIPELEEMAVAHQATFAVEMVQDNKGIMQKPGTAAQVGLQALSEGYSYVTNTRQANRM